MTHSHSVAIITRTKNRKVLLERALNSVLGQTFEDFVWVIVNDGGSKDHVDKIAAKAKSSGRDVVVIHHDESLGMESASNAGVNSATSGFVVIHDDDDSWQPTFLEKTVTFLCSNEGLKYGGVITHSIQVEEKYDGKSCSVWSKVPFNSGLNNIDLCVIAHSNKFPPISFLFRRECYDVLGGYDESLPVLGDWDFNLRFLTKYDIAVIPKLLANYHHRVKYIHMGSYGNSIIQGRCLIKEYENIVRNRYVRMCSSQTEGQIGQAMIAIRCHDVDRKYETTVNKLRKKYVRSHAGFYYRKILSMFFRLP